MYKIYCIIDNTNDNVYIGQTKQKLYSRISVHRSDFKRGKYCSSQIILKNNDWTYKILEDDLDPYEAKQREAFYIQNTDNCINEKTLKYGRGKGDPEKYKKANKEWLEKNKEHRNNYMKKYNLNKNNYIKSWGGDPRSNNNLLRIDVDLFQN
jgi:hypothetical protein